MVGKLLIVDDNDNQHELFRCYATGATNLELNHAADIQQAVSAIETDMPDLVFLDNRLHPYQDYRQTVPLIRRAGFDGKIVLISSDIDHPVFNAAKEYSVHSCVDKFEFSLENFGDKLSQIAASPL